MHFKKLPPAICWRSNIPKAVRTYASKRFLGGPDHIGADRCLFLSLIKFDTNCDIRHVFWVHWAGESSRALGNFCTLPQLVTASFRQKWHHNGWVAKQMWIVWLGSKELTTSLLMDPNSHEPHLLRHWRALYFRTKSLGRKFTVEENELTRWRRRRFFAHACRDICLHCKHPGALALKTPKIIPRVSGQTEWCGTKGNESY